MEQAARAEAEARAELVGRVKSALESGLAGQFVDPDDGESMQRAAEIAVQVFADVLREPPARVVPREAPVPVELIGRWGKDGQEIGGVGP